MKISTGPFNSTNPNVRLILRDLVSGPNTLNELQHILGISNKCLREYLYVLQRERLIHIVGYERTRGRPRVIYSAGPGPNKPFKPHTSTARANKWRGENRDFYNQQQRRRYYQRKANSTNTFRA